jgi:hypothetical protein
MQGEDHRLGEEMMHLGVVLTMDGREACLLRGLASTPSLDFAQLLLLVPAMTATAGELSKPETGCRLIRCSFELPN